LPASVRNYFEPRFQHDFSDVRLHKNHAAAGVAQDAGALAFTAGRDIVFGPGQYSPETPAGKRLMAHELTHFVQQSERGSEITVQKKPQATTMTAKQNVTGVKVTCGDDGGFIVFLTSGKDYSYKLKTCNIPEGSYDTGVTVTGGDVKWDLGEQLKEGEQGEFDYEIAPGQQNPATLFKGQKRVHIDVKKQQNASSQLGYRVEIMTAEEYFSTTGRSVADLPDRKMVSPSDAGFTDQVNASNWAPGLGSALVLPARPAFPLPQNSTGVLWSGGHASDFSVVEGDFLLRGFRAELWRHGVSNFERSKLGEVLWGPGGGPRTTSLNRGVPGSWAKDWLFPYSFDAIAVYPDRPQTAEEAAAFAEYLKSRGPEYADKTYRYSPPKPNTPAWDKTYGDTPAGFCPPGAANCLNLPLEEHQRALAGANFEPGQPGPETGRARNMRPWLEDPHPGLRTVRVGPAMRARLATGVVKAGGMVLLIYGGVQTYKRIDEATPEELPIVVGEEAGSWIGGWVGGVLSEALAGAFICAETGPGAFVCAVAAGAVGGLGGSVVGHGIGHNVAEGLNLIHDTPRFIESSILLFGSPEDRRNYYEMRELETGEKDPLDL
jgi:hypothetical protein